MWSTNKLPPRPHTNPLTARLLIGTVIAIGLVIALERRIDALLPVGASELVQPTLGARASVLVAAAATVQIAVAFLLLRQTNGAGRCGHTTVRRLSASDVVRLALAIGWTDGNIAMNYENIRL